MEGVFRVLLAIGLAFAMALNVKTIKSGSVGFGVFGLTLTSMAIVINTISIIAIILK